MEKSYFPLYLYAVAGYADGRNQAICGYSFIVKTDIVLIVQIIVQQFNLLRGHGFNGQVRNLF